MLFCLYSGTLYKMTIVTPLARGTPCFGTNTASHKCPRFIATIVTLTFGVHFKVVLIDPHYLYITRLSTPKELLEYLTPTLDSTLYINTWRHSIKLTPNQIKICIKCYYPTQIESLITT
jgi:hypothetical protein